MVKYSKRKDKKKKKRLIYSSIPRGGFVPKGRGPAKIALDRAAREIAKAASGQISKNTSLQDVLKMYKNMRIPSALMAGAANELGSRLIAGVLDSKETGFYNQTGTDIPFIQAETVRSRVAEIGRASSRDRV